MKYQDPITLKAVTQTPVFIWDGQICKSISYVIDGDLVLVVNMDRFLSALSDKQRQFFQNWIDPIMDRISELDKKVEQVKRTKNKDLEHQLIRQKRQESAKLNLDQFIRSQLGEKNPATYIRRSNGLLYEIRWKARPGDDGFRCFIKNFQRQPYVPGSEIKGSIRTAVLLSLLGDSNSYQLLRDDLLEFRKILRSNIKTKEKLRNLENVDRRLQSATMRPFKDDAKYDLLRDIHLTDGNLLTTQELNIYALESYGSSRFTKTMVEGMAPGTTFTFRMSLPVTNEQLPMDIFHELKLDKLVKEGWFSVEKILMAIFTRSKTILDFEMNYWKNDAEMLKKIQALRAVNEERSPLLRLGSGQGFLSVTIDLCVVQNDPQLFEEAIREGVSLQRRWRTMPGNFPKTRRIVSDGRGKPLILPGWIKVAVD